ncbi:MAG TPA: efflux RND transporter permease subunit, partial [Gemmatimonadaceae bacterium]|nr:efflux RND transporter permease subunit [Gemmatimonadaceae bacterium]
MSDAEETPTPDLASGPPSFANQIVRASLNQKFLVVVAALVLIGVGSWSFTRLPVDAYPDLSPPMVEITTQWP